MALSAVAGLLSVVWLAVAAPLARAETKPENTGLPSISGAAKELGTLNAAHGTWTGGALTYTYQWQRCEAGVCSNIAGATASSYVAKFPDVDLKLDVVVTATNKIGSAHATSPQTGLIAGIPPKNEGAPPTVEGSAVEGQLLTINRGGWHGTEPITYTYAWERCVPEKSCVEIAGAAEQSYRVQKADLHDELRAKVTARNTIIVEELGEPVTKEEKVVRTTEKTSAVTEGAPVIVGFPKILGVVRKGSTLTASAGEWHGAGPIEYTYGWENCASPTSCTTAEGTTYALGAGDVGHTLKLYVTAKNGYGMASSSSISTPKVLAEGQSFAVAWGEDTKGQAGTLYKTTWESTPVLMEGAFGAIALSSRGYFSMALHEGGTITASGAAGEGAIGNNLHSAPWELGESYITVGELEPVAEISSGGDYALARQENGDIEAWGSNFLGQLGNGNGGFEFETGENTHTPKEVKALNGKGVTSIASGGKANFAIVPGGEVYAWGYNGFGQLGVKWKLPECETVKNCEPAVKAKHYNKEPGGSSPYFCWDEIKSGQLCGKTPSPVEVLNEAEEEVPLKGVKRITAGNNATYALLESGEVLSWGSNNRGQLGQTLTPEHGAKFKRPGYVMTSSSERLQHVVSIAAGTGFAIAVLESGAVVGWGEDDEGQLGTAATTCGTGGGTWSCDRWATTITALEGVHATAVAAGSATSFVLDNEGNVHSVGQNKYGELGIGPACENEGGELGTNKKCFDHAWHTITGLNHVTAISAGNKAVSALVSGAGSPPRPVIQAEPQSETLEGKTIKALKAGWTLPEGEASLRFRAQRWEHPAEEGAEYEEGDEPEPWGEGTGAAPTNTTLPSVTQYESLEGEKVHNDLVVGIYLKATAGTWEGSELKYAYRWLLCKSSKCSVLRSWIEGSEGATLQVPAESPGGESVIGDTIEGEVAAWSSGSKPGFALSTPTEMVKEGGAVKELNVKLEGDNGYLFNQFEGEPLEEATYEVKLVTEDSSKEQILRTLVATP